MKIMTCKQLGGACDQEFHANSFEEIVKISKQHGTDMFNDRDPAHLAAMDDMLQLIQIPDAMTKWLESKRQEFAALPEN